MKTTYKNFRIEITNSGDHTYAAVYRKGGRKEIAGKAFPRNFVTAAMAWAEDVADKN